jgi:hypothetical protein
MKNSFFILSILAIVLNASCDRIENPVVINNPSLDWSLYPDSDTNNYPWPVWTQNTNTARRVLLEDYTGHTCTNCPSAAVIAKNIEDANGGNVIVLSVHASTTGGFQLPSPPELPLDHRTEAGNAYATAMNIAFNPAGTVNRTITGGNYYIFSSDWASVVATELPKAPDFNLQVAYNYFSQTEGLFLHTETEILNDVAGDYNIISFLVRDTLVAPQENSGGVLIEEYDHHSVLTDNINGIWGTPIITGGATAGDKLYNNFTYKVPVSATDTSFQINNLSVITVISDRSTYEIHQVYKTSLAE